MRLGMIRFDARRLAVALTSAGAGLAVVGFANSASASGFSTARFGGEHGHPTTDNPTALYYNPAGLAEDAPDAEEKFWHVKIFADGALALRWASWTHARSASDTEEPADASGANSGEANLFNVAGAPMIGASVQIENFAFGLGFFVPFGGASTWDKNERFRDDPNYAGPVDGIQRWHTIDGTLRSMYLSLGVAYDIIDRISIGAAVNFIRSDVQTLRARNADGSNEVETEGRALIDVGGWSPSFALGVTGEIAPKKVWLGFSYQSQPNVGPMTLEGTLTTNLAGNVNPQDVKLIQSLPDIYRFGVRARPRNDLEIRVFGDVTNWSTFENQCVIPAGADECPINADGSSSETDPTKAPLINIARDWGPAFGLRVGGSYWVVPSIELFLGAGYDSNAIPDTTLEPALTDFQKASVAGGLRFTAGKVFGFAISYTHLFYVPRETAGQSILPALKSPSTTPDAGGRYTQTIGVIDANAQLTF